MEPIGSNQTTGREEIIERQLRLWNARRLAAKEKVGTGSRPRYQFFTMARDEGSLGDEIAVDLSRSLGWHVFDKEIVTYIAGNGHVREGLVRQLDQKSQGLLEDMISRLLRMPEYASFGSEEYHEALLKTLVCLATHGHAILVGRGANFALGEDQRGLRLRITASLEVRAQRLNRIWKVAPDEARQRIRTGDEERRKFIRQYFRRDFDDVLAYDLLFNTDRLSVKDVAASVLSFTNDPAAVQAEKPPK